MTTRDATPTKIKEKGKVPNLRQVTQHDGDTDYPVSFGGAVTIKDSTGQNDPQVWEKDGCIKRQGDAMVMYLGGEWVPFGATKSVQNMTLYVSPTGDDDDGDGSVTSPYATITRAYRDVPYLVEHKIVIRILAGTYTDFPANVNNQIGRQGQLSFEGIGTPPVSAGPFTVNTATKTGGAMLEINVAAAGWGVDDFYGKFVRMTSGDAIGRVFPIHRNSADTIETIHPYWPDPAPANTFNVIDPAVTINLDHGVTWNIVSMRDYNYAQFTMSNLSFYDDMSDPTPGAAFSYIGNSNAIFGLVRFHANQTYEGTWYQCSGAIGFRTPLDYTVLDDPDLLCYPLLPTSISWPSVQVLVQSTPPTTEKVGVQLAGGTGIGADGGVEFYGFSTRGKTNIYTAKGAIGYSIMAGSVMDHMAKAQLFDCGLSCGTVALHGLLVQKGAVADLNGVYTKSTPQSALAVQDLGTIVMEATGGNTAGITGYGLLMGRGCKVVAVDAAGPIGTSGQIRFEQTAATVAYPAATNWQTDAVGSSVIA